MKVYECNDQYNSVIIKGTAALDVKRQPLVVLSGSKDYYWNVGTGMMSEDVEEVKEEGVEYQMFYKKNAVQYGISVQYDESVDGIAVILCVLNLKYDTDTKKGDEQRPREWIEADRLYIDQNKKVWVHGKLQQWGSGCYLNYIPQFIRGTVFADDNNIFSSHWFCDEQNVYYPANATRQMFYGYPNNNIVIINSTHIIENDRERVWYEWETMKPFHDIFGETVPIAGNKMISLDSLNSFILYSKYKEPKMKADNTGLLEIELPDVDVSVEFQEKELPPLLKNNFYDTLRANVKSFAVVQRVPHKDPMCVVRFFFAGYYNQEAYEGSRIYVSDKKVIAFKKVRDSFIKKNMDNHHENYLMPLLAFDKSVLEGTKLQYFGSVLEKIPDELKTSMMFTFLRYPIIEKMYKSQFEDIVTTVVANSHQVGPVENLCSLFGIAYTGTTQWDKETDIYKVLGMNTYQATQVANLIRKYFDCYRHFLYYATRYGIGRFFKLLAQSMVGEGGNITSIDKETTDYFISIIEKGLNEFCKPYSIKKALKDIQSGVYPKYPKSGEWASLDKEAQKYGGWHPSFFNSAYIDACKKTLEIYSLPVLKKAEPWIFENTKNYIHDKREMNQYAVNLIRQRRTPRFIDEDGTINVEVLTSRNKTLFDYLRYDKKVLDVYNDTIDMIHLLGLSSQMKPYFKDIQDLLATHDNMIIILNQKQIDVEQKKWNDRLRYFSEFAYAGNEDDEFSIVAPAQASDLAVEGSTLKHCVRVYIQKVIEAKTNILFLRKKKDLGTPFYTIELDMDNVVRQVHGSCNCNATPEVLNFVKQWAKVKKLKMTNVNTIR